jgi:hypothetical protein
MVTRGSLLEKGAIAPKNAKSIWDLELDGILYVEKPSDNGNGWYLGDCSDTDNLVMESLPT